MNKRLFLAINIPKDIKDQLADLLLKLQENNKNKPIKWVEPENVHLTLHFLGDTPEEKIKEIDQTLQPIVADFPTLDFQLSDSINAFPNLNLPQVIFLEMKELNDGKTLKMQKQIGEALEDIGFTIDKRPFRLHLTLGRVKFKTEIDITNFQIHNSEFRIKEIDLMASQLTPSGPIYSVVTNYKLS
jgi:2'-5' RNA ligase